MKRAIATLFATIGLFSACAGVASASTEFPTIGDRITYVFTSDSRNVESIYWYNADNDDVLYPTGTDRHAVFKKRTTGGFWTASVSFISRSTTQLTGSYVSAHDGLFVSCDTFVNGVRVNTDFARGRYATAYC